ncbi:MAG: PilZ domain-containing protein [Armatimonadetes bacterium]|nr:PilZ domain-containing protein [Armatimonadota bacterium]
MFRFLRGPEQVSWFSLEGDVLIFLSDRPRGLGERVRLRLSVPGGRRDVRVEVASQRATPQGWVCTALHRGQLDGLASPQPEFQRRSPRVAVSARVMSRELPGYRAVSVDLSLEGIQLALEAPLQPGQELELTVDDEGGAPLRLRARVVWCRPGGGPRAYRAGMEFVDLDAETAASLRRWHHALTLLQEADVQHRTLGSAGWAVG